MVYKAASFGGPSNAAVVYNPRLFGVRALTRLHVWLDEASFRRLCDPSGVRDVRRERDCHSLGGPRTPPVCFILEIQLPMDLTTSWVLCSGYRGRLSPSWTHSRYRHEVGRSEPPRLRRRKARRMLGTYPVEGSHAAGHVRALYLMDR